MLFTKLLTLADEERLSNDTNWRIAKKCLIQLMLKFIVKTDTQNTKVTATGDMAVGDVVVVGATEMRCNTFMMMQIFRF